MSFSISLDKANFEGPLDLLLQLVQKRKLFINDISLAEVTDEFVSHVGDLEENMADVSEFLVVAATLLLIKSRSLLPTIDLTDDEEVSIEELEERLRRLAIVHKVREQVREQYGKTVLRPIRPPRLRDAVFAPPSDLNLTAVTVSLARVLQSLPVPEQKTPQARVTKVRRLEDVIIDLAGRVRKNMQLSFREFSGTKSEKVHVVVNFLALLELFKQNIVHASQVDPGGDIIMQTVEDKE